MKKNLTIVILIVSLLLPTLATVFFATDSDMPAGFGTGYDPFLIENAEQFYALQGKYIGMEGAIKLTADIVLNDETFTFSPDTGLVKVSDGINVGYLGTGTCGDASGGNTVFDTVASEAGVWYLSDVTGEKGEYSGEIRAWHGLSTYDYESINLNGNGHTISGLYVNNDSYAGLLGYADGSVRNLTVTNAYVCGKQYAGGLVGSLEYGSIANSQFDGIVCGNSAVGGIAGSLGSNATIANCTANGYVLGEQNIGGILGAGNGSVRYCRNFAAVNAETNAAGIAAIATEVFACVNLGAVSADSVASGITGKASATLECIGCGPVSADTAAFAITQPENGLAEKCYYVSDYTIATDARADALRISDLGKAESFASLDFAYTWYMPQDTSLPDYIFNAPRDLSNALWDGRIADGFASGDGSMEDPYIIENASQLAYLAQTVNDGSENYQGKCIRLDANIQLNDYTQENWILGAIQWTPIGGVPMKTDRFSTATFRGVFDGNHHTISGLYIDTPGNNLVGLFGFNDFATVKNLRITNSFVRGMSYVGAFAGDNNGGKYQNCYTNATVFGGRYVGGLVGVGANLYECEFDGYVYGFTGVGGLAGDSDLTNCRTTENAKVVGYYTVGGIAGMGGCSNCENYASVKGYTKGVGGIAGYFYGSYCHNYADVIGADYTGGIAGYSYGNIRYCQNQGNVYGNDDVGGIVGHKYYDPILACQNDGAVIGRYNVGGIAGYQAIDGIDPANISMSCNNGDVTGTAYVGGIAGYASDKILYCYNTANISGKLLIGGLAGYTKSSFTSGFNVGQVRGDRLVGAIAGDTSKEYYSESPYLKDCARLTSGQICYGSSGYYDNSALTKEEFSQEESLNSQELTLGEFFFLSDSCWHPLLSWQILPSEHPDTAKSFDGGSGSENDPYIISTKEQLRLLSVQTNLGNTYPNTYFFLKNDLTFDEGDLLFTPIGKFEGDFNGGDHILSGLTIYGEDNVGLFSHNLGTIYNLSLFDSYVNGITNVGGIAGKNEGSILNCSSRQNSLYGYDNVGGIAGNGYGGEHKDCTNSSTVRAANNNVGGIVGYGGNCLRCSNNGNINGNEYVGGIAGYSNALISNCINDHGYIHGQNYIGGIAGYNNASTELCANKGTVYSYIGIAGGIVGESRGNVQYCLNSGKVTSQSNAAAGIVGRIAGNPTISYCINLGNVCGSKAAGIALNATYPKGGTVTACYYRKGSATTWEGEIKSGLGAENDKYTHASVFETIAVEESVLGKIATYSKIVDFSTHFVFERQNGSLFPVLRRFHTTHVFDTLRTTEEYLVSEGNCIKGSTYLLSCSCGEKGTFLGSDPNPVADKHSLSEETIYKTDGHYQICNDCKKEIKVAEHLFTERVTTEAYKLQAGNCKTAAVYCYSCKCGEKSTKQFYGDDFGDHDYSELVYTEEGHFFACTLCGIDTTDIIPHSFGQGEVYTEPTTEQEGEQIYTCSECDYKRYETIEKLPEVVTPPDNDDPLVANPVPKGNDTLILVGIGAGIAILAAGIIVWWILKKKK